MKPLSREDLMSLWRSVVDPGYSQPLLRDPQGIAGIEAVADALSRTSQSIATNHEASFIMPFSGQDGEPAGGARLATTTLTVTRTGVASGEVTIVQGFPFEELQNDYGPDGSVPVMTGRRYLAARNVVLGPGVLSVDVPVVAERAGYGYNLPLPGSIGEFVQPGAGLANDQAILIAGMPSHQLVMAPRADAVGPQCVGLYVLLQTGANAGQRRRVIDFVPPVNDAYAGVAVLASTGVLRGTLAGDFEPGEVAEQPTTGATGTVVGASDGYLVYDRTSFPKFDTSAPIFGVRSGAMLVPTSVEQDPALAGDPSVAWKVLDFESDLSLAAMNPESPSGGRSPMLDQLGYDRSVQRSPGEADDAYRVRVWKLPDVVSPNALRRAANRVLAQYGSSGCLREVGAVDSLFPGFFYDVSPADVGFDSRYAYAYDLDFQVRPEDRFKLVMDYTEFRAFFEVGVPAASLGEFGFFYDALGVYNFYDAAPYLAFFDGFPLTSAVVNRRVWDALNVAHAGGVTFDLYEERLGCF